MSTQNIEATPTGTNEESSRRGEEGQANVLQDPPNAEEFSGGSIDSRNMPFSFHGATAILPEVHTVTGEILDLVKGHRRKWIIPTVQWSRPLLSD